MRIFERWYFGLCWNLRLVIELWYLEGFWFLVLWTFYFCMLKYLNFHYSSFAFRYFLMELARPQCDTPLVPCYQGEGTLPSCELRAEAQGPGRKALTCPYPKNLHHFLCLLIVRIVIVNEYVIDWLNCIQFWTVESYQKKINWGEFS
jgi:hypothetical protein